MHCTMGQQEAFIVTYVFIVTINAWEKSYKARWVYSGSQFKDTASMARKVRH